MYKTQVMSKKVNTCNITYELVNSLVYPYVVQRSVKGLSKKIFRKIDFALNWEPQQNVNFFQKNLS